MRAGSPSPTRASIFWPKTGLAAVTWKVTLLAPLARPVSKLNRCPEGVAWLLAGSGTIYLMVKCSAKAGDSKTSASPEADAGSLKLISSSDCQRVIRG